MPAVMAAIIIAVIFIILPPSSDTGKAYCTIRSPVNAIYNNIFSTNSYDHTCESQHVIQQQSGGGHEKNNIWIPTIMHSYLDRTTCKPWENQRPSFNIFGNENINRAYMIGVWANGSYFTLYNYRPMNGSGVSTATEWDGPSAFMYLYSSIINFPQKEINYIAYQFERMRKNQNTAFLDAAIGIVVDLVELVISIPYYIIGIFIGTILNPIDSIQNIFDLPLLLISSTYQSIAQAIKGVASIVTFGWWGSCG